MHDLIRVPLPPRFAYTLYTEGREKGGGGGGGSAQSQPTNKSPEGHSAPLVNMLEAWQEAKTLVVLHASLPLWVLCVCGGRLGGEASKAEGEWSPDLTRVGEVGMWRLLNKHPCSHATPPSSSDSMCMSSWCGWWGGIWLVEDRHWCCIQPQPYRFPLACCALLATLAE